MNSKHLVPALALSILSAAAPATLPLSTGPTPIQLAQFPQGGTIGSDMFGDRTVVKKN